MGRSFRTLLLIVLSFATTLGATVPGMAQGDDAIVVTSQQFTEQYILAEMLALLLEDAGYTVDRQFDFGVSTEIHEAMLAGEVDVYVEYTGTGLVAILGTPVPDADAGTPVAAQVYDAVSTAYPAQYGLIWLGELGFDNTYALAVSGELADELGVTTISDLAEHAPDLALGTDNEFSDRPDGLDGLDATYGITFGEVVAGEPAAMYTAIAEGEVDVITAYTTDGQLVDSDLVVLEDDLGLFPPYHAAPVVRQELLDADPDLAAVLDQLAGLIDDETMAGLNNQVDQQGADPAEVARDFLVEQGLIAAD